MLSLGLKLLSALGEKGILSLQQLMCIFLNDFKVTMFTFLRTWTCFTFIRYSLSFLRFLDFLLSFFPISISLSFLNKNIKSCFVDIFYFIKFVSSVVTVKFAYNALKLSVICHADKPFFLLISILMFLIFHYFVEEIWTFVIVHFLYRCIAVIFKN